MLTREAAFFAASEAAPMRSDGEVGSDPPRLPPISKRRGSLAPHLVRKKETARRTGNLSSQSGETNETDHRSSNMV